MRDAGFEGRDEGGEFADLNDVELVAMFPRPTGGQLFEQPEFRHTQAPACLHTVPRKPREHGSAEVNGADCIQCSVFSIQFRTPMMRNTTWILPILNTEY